MTAGVKAVFLVKDSAGDALIVTDDHDMEVVKVGMTEGGPWVGLSLEQVDALADALREIYYRRQRDAQDAS